MMEKLCVFCKHWEFEEGQQGFSEMTPGSNASMGCDKGHFGEDFCIYDIQGSSGFREIIIKAETCPDYTPVVG